MTEPRAMTGHSPLLSADPAASLTDRLARGDSDALDELYRDWYPRLLALARRATGRDDAFAHDTVHDAFLRVIRKPARCSTDAQLSAWLRRCLLSAAIDALRAEGRRLARERRHAEPELQDATSSSHPHPADQLLWLAEQIRTLDPADRELLHLRFVAEQSLQSIADTSPGLTWSAIHGRIRRLLRTLQRRSPDHPSASSSTDAATRTYDPPANHP